MRQREIGFGGARDGNSVVTASDKKMRVKRSLLIGLGRAGSSRQGRPIYSAIPIASAMIYDQGGAWELS